MEWYILATWLAGLWAHDEYKAMTAKPPMKKEPLYDDKVWRKANGLGPMPE